MVGSATHQMIAVRTGRVNRRGLRICAFLGYRGGQGEEHQEETDEKPLPEHFSIVSATDGRYGMVVWYGTIWYGIIPQPSPTNTFMPWLSSSVVDIVISLKSVSERQLVKMFAVSTKNRTKADVANATTQFT